MKKRRGANPIRTFHYHRYRTPCFVVKIQLTHEIIPGLSVRASSCQVIALDIAWAFWYSASKLKGSSNRRRFRRASFRQHGGSSTRARHPDSRQDLARPLFTACLTMPRVKVFLLPGGANKEGS